MRIRPVTQDDYPALNRLLSDVWFPTRSMAGWAWLLEQNPHQGDRPSGYVACDTQNTILGFLGATGVELVNQRETLYATSGHSVVAAPQTPGAGVLLLRSLLQSDFGTAAYTLNNNALVQPIYDRLGGLPLSPQTADTTLNWITNHSLLAKAGFYRRYQRLRSFKTARSQGEQFARFELPDPAFSPSANHVKPCAFPFHDCPDLAHFWERLSSSEPFYMRRDTAALKWRFSNPDQTLDPIMFVFDRGNGVEGWLIAQVSKETEISAPILTIVDLIALDDAVQSAYPTLVSTAIEASRQMRLQRVQLPFADKATINALKPLLKSSNIHKGHIHAHAKFHQNTDTDMLERNWRLTPFDGDFTYCLRQPPIV